jgi:hypothetical protein
MAEEEIIYFTTSKDARVRKAIAKSRVGTMVTMMVQDVVLGEEDADAAKRLRMMFPAGDGEEEEEEAAPPTREYIHEACIPLCEYAHVRYTNDTYKELLGDVLFEKKKSRNLAKATLPIYEEAMYRFLQQGDAALTERFYRMEDGCRKFQSDKGKRISDKRKGIEVEKEYRYHWDV